MKVITTILAVLTLTVGAALWAANSHAQNRELTVINRTEIQNMDKNLDRIDQKIEKLGGKFAEKIDRLESKIDRLLERD